MPRLAAPPLQEGSICRSDVGSPTMCLDFPGWSPADLDPPFHLTVAVNRTTATSERCPWNTQSRHAPHAYMYDGRTVRYSAIPDLGPPVLSIFQDTRSHSDGDVNSCGSRNDVAYVPESPRTGRRTTPNLLFKNKRRPWLCAPQRLE